MIPGPLTPGPRPRPPARAGGGRGAPPGGGGGRGVARAWRGGSGDGPGGRGDGAHLLAFVVAGSAPVREVLAVVADQVVVALAEPRHRAGDDLVGVAVAGV